MSDQAYTIFEIRKMKSPSQMNAAFKHNFRLKDVPNASPELATGNEELVKLQYESFNDAFRQKYKELDYYKTRKLRKDAVKGIEVVLSYSPKDGEGYDSVSIEKWKDQSVQWLKDNFNVQPKGCRDNVVSVVYHGDETAPHIHALIIPVTKEGHLSAREIAGGPQNIYRLKESYGKSMENLGLRAPKSRSTYHLSYERNQKLKQRTEEAIKAIPIPGDHEPGEAYYKRSIEAIKDYCASMVGESNRQRWELNRKAEIKAEDTIKQAQDQAEEITLGAQTQAESTVNKANEHAKRREEEARKKVEEAAEQLRIADHRLQNANMQLEQLRREMLGMKKRDKRSSKELYENALKYEELSQAIEWYSQNDSEHAEQLSNALQTLTDSYREVQQEQNKNMQR